MSKPKYKDAPIVGLWRQYTDWLREYMPRSYDNLAPGATKDDFARVAKVIGHELPFDVRALLKVNNGQLETEVATAEGDNAAAFPVTCLLSTKLIIKQWREWRKLKIDDDESMHVVGSTLAPQLVKPHYANRHWVPLLNASLRSDFFGLDFDPEPGGQPGQVINFGRDEECHYVAAPNLTGLLEIIIPAVIAAGPARPQPPVVVDNEEYFDDEDADEDLYPYFENYWADYRHSFETVYYSKHPTGFPNSPAVSYKQWISERT